MAGQKFKRILVKLSGERMGADRGSSNLEVSQISLLADEIVALHDAGMEVGVVLGGGNIVRGASIAESGIEEAQGHYMGMLATVINALALQNMLEQKGKQTRVMSALRIDSVVEPYIRRRAIRHIEKGRIVIFAGGTGNPFFSTDTCGALRAVEIGADLLVKATKIDGIYSADPAKDPKAEHLPEISYKEALVRDLKVMDGAAIAICREQGMPLMVCAVNEPGSLLAAIKGKAKRTVVSGE